LRLGILGQQIPRLTDAEIACVVRGGGSRHGGGLVKVRALPGRSPSIKGSQFQEFSAF
jgi:hypothetical protein